MVFYLGKNAAFKRRWFPRFSIFAGGLFLAFVTAFIGVGPGAKGGLLVLTLMVPMLVLITFLNIKMTKFCDKCGATLINSNWFVPMRFCSKCGAALEGKPKSFEDRLE